MSPITMSCVRVFCDTKTTAGGGRSEMGTAGTEVLAVGSGGLGWAPPGPRSWRWALGVWDWDRRDRGPGGGLWGLG